MEFFISTLDAQQAIKALGVTAKMNTTSFEGQVLIKTKENSVVFTSNNGNSGISFESPARVLLHGETTIVYSRMKSFIMTFNPWDGTLGAKEFRFKIKPPKLKISIETFHDEYNSSKSNLNLEQLKASSFMLPVVMDEVNLILNSSVVKSAIDKTLFAIDPNGTEDFMKGLRMVLHDGKIIYTATNGRTVSDYTVSNESGLVNGEYFLSYEFLMGLRRVLINDVQLFFDISKQKIKISFENILFWSNSLNYKEWPKTDSVWSLFDKTIKISREILVNGLSACVDILDADDYNRVTMEMKDEKLLLTTDCSLFEFPDVEGANGFIVDLDGKDFINAIKSLSDDTIEIKFLNEKSGVIIESKGFDNQKVFITNLIRR